MAAIVWIFWISAGLVLYAYVVYPALLLLVDLLGRRPAFQRGDIQPKVSVVIAAYNEEKVIRSRIENLLGLDYPADHLEIMIASDGSSDGTNDIVREYEGRGVKLMAFEGRNGKVNVLNATVPQASHALVVFSDANTMFKHDAITKLVRHFADERVGCVCGGLLFVNADGSTTGDLESVYWRYETFMKKMEGRRGCLLGANGAIFMIRKELFVRLPGDTVVEDFVLPMKILQRGRAVIYDPDATAIEEAAHKIIQEKERRIRIGAGDFQALFRLLPMLNPLKGFPALAFWSHKVLRWLAPFFLIGALVSNLFLLDYPFYRLMMALQVIFYGAAFAGQQLNRRGRSIKLLNLCYYFVSMNGALLQGFFRFLCKQQKVAWDRTER